MVLYVGNMESKEDEALKSELKQPGKDDKNWKDKESSPMDAEPFSNNGMNDLLTPSSPEEPPKADEENTEGHVLNPYTGFLETPTRSNNIARDHSSSDSSSSSSGDEFSHKDDQKRQKMNIPKSGSIIPGVPASPPQFVSLEQIMKAANAVSKMALAHEIAVNKDFKLEKVELPESSLETKVRETMHKAFWDVLQSDLNEEPPVHKHSIVLLTEIKEALLSLLLPHHTKLHQAICEVLDIDLIKQQVENQALNFHYYAQYIISIMSKLCAPVRDDDIRELMRVESVVPTFRGILQTIDLMKLDMANFHIQLIRPHLQQQSIEYEKKKFAEYLELQDDGLLCTRHWLRRNAEALARANLNNSNGLLAGASALSEQVPSSDSIIMASYMELLQWDQDNIFPETLIMDQSRFLEISSRIEFVTLLSSVMLVTYNTVGAAISGISDFKVQLKDHLNVLLEGFQKLSNLNDVMKNVAIQVVKEVNECLVSHGFQEMSAEKDAILKGQIEEVAASQHAVRQLVKKRILEFVESILSSLTASPVKIPPGLSSMQMELSRIAGQVLRLVSHNRAVFGDYYAEIIAAGLKESWDMASAVDSIVTPKEISN